MCTLAFLVKNNQSLGIVHVLTGPDHLSAIATLSANVGHTGAAFGLGVRWGLGHSTGLLLVVDTIWSMAAFSFAQTRPALTSVMKRLLCSRLYLHFLWTRRMKIGKLATQMRGGAAQFPFYVLQVLMEPAASMGLEVASSKDDASR